MLNRLTQSMDFQAKALSLRAERQRVLASNIQPPAGALSESGLRYALNSQTSLDSNTVDMDRERASFAENSVKYEATLRFLNGQVKTALDAMKSHTQG